MGALTVESAGWIFAADPHQQDRHKKDGPARGPRKLPAPWRYPGPSCPVSAFPAFMLSLGAAGFGARRG
jgi:hypothetical protein